MNRVLLIGRPNVGKSTLFNRMHGKRKAIVEDRPGTTRDWQETPVVWRGKSFLLVDTGGLPAAKSPISSQISQQIEALAGQASVLVFLGDAQAGPTHTDFSLANWTRQRNKPIVWAINKVDGPRQEMTVSEFHQLGCPNLVPVSALHGKGIGELLDEVVNLLPKDSDPIQRAGQTTRIAVVGRPNVGKSTLINHLVGKNRLLVHEEPGTTRDAVEVPCQYEDQSFILVDTAGVRARGKRKTPVEVFSVSHTQQAISDSELILCMLDSEIGLVRDDLRILQLIEKSSKPAILLVNKWDRVKGVRFADFEELLRSRLIDLAYVPILSISALTGRGTDQIFDNILKILRPLEIAIPTSEFNGFLKEVQQDPHSPLIPLTKPLKFYYGCQIKKNPPTFQIVANLPDRIPRNYERWFEDQTRQKFGLTSLPIRIKWKERER